MYEDDGWEDDDDSQKHQTNLDVVISKTSTIRWCSFNDNNIWMNNHKKVNNRKRTLLNLALVFANISLGYLTDYQLPTTNMKVVPVYKQIYEYFIDVLRVRLVQGLPFRGTPSLNHLTGWSSAKPSKGHCNVALRPEMKCKAE